MQVKPGYKQTEVGVIPEDWEVNTIASIAMISGGGTPRTDVTEYWDGQIPWVSAGDVSRANGRYIYSTIDHISELGLASCSAKIVPGGTTVIIARGATVGRMAQLESAMTFNQTCYGLLPVAGIDRNYLYYAMLFSVSSMKALTYGTIFGTITTNSFQQWKMPLPPTLAEQETIAAALSDADALIESLEQLVAKKRQVKQGAMQELLTGKRRLPGFSGEWEVKRLGELAEIHSGGTPSTIRPEYWDGDILWCTPTDITALRGFKYLSDTSRKISTLGLKSSSAEMIPANSIVMTSRATIGECAINQVPVSTNQGFKNFIPFDNVDVEFLYYLLVTKKQDFISLCGGSTFLEVGKTQLASFEIQLPAVKAEQTAIAAILSDMDAELAALEAKLAKARQVKQGMMQELLTGRIRLV